MTDIRIDRHNVLLERVAVALERIASPERPTTPALDKLRRALEPLEGMERQNVLILGNFAFSLNELRDIYKEATHE